MSATMPSVPTRALLAALTRDAIDAANSSERIHGPDSETTRESAVSSPSSDETRVVVAVRKPTKKRKATYHVRKEAIVRLEDEAVALRARIQQMQQQRVGATQALLSSVATNASLRSLIKNNALAIAGAQSMLSLLASEPAFVPFSSYVHLPRDAQQRRKKLEALRVQQLRNAAEFLIARRKFADPRREYAQCETHEAENGDHTAALWEGYRIEGAKSVRQVFEIVKHMFQNQEISISERLGVLTVRESDDDQISPDLYQARMLSTLATGQLVEKNLVVFCEYYVRSDLLEEPHALVVIDAVDKDDLYPYQPRERLRKDVSSAMLITACPPHPSDKPGKLTASLARWCRIHTHNSKSENHSCVPPSAMEQSNLTRWSDVMILVIRELIECCAAATDNNHRSH